MTLQGSIALDDGPPFAVRREKRGGRQHDERQRCEQQPESKKDAQKSCGARPHQAKHTGAQRIDLRERADEDRGRTRDNAFAFECNE